MTTTPSYSGRSVKKNRGNSSDEKKWFDQGRGLLPLSCRMAGLFPPDFMQYNPR
jgi:hypothetical protein